MRGRVLAFPEAGNHLFGTHYMADVERGAHAMFGSPNDTADP